MKAHSLSATSITHCSRVGTAPGHPTVAAWAGRGTFLIAQQRGRPVPCESAEREYQIKDKAFWEKKLFRIQHLERGTRTSGRLNCHRVGDRILSLGKSGSSTGSEKEV